MELSSHEADIAIPLNATYGGGGGGNGGGHSHAHLIHHDHHNHIINPSTHPQIPSTTNGQSSIPPSSVIDHHNHHHHDHHAPTTTTTTTTTNSNNSFKKMVRYRECLKNHAAAMGGTATDGCGEFMPSGEEGTIEALTCSACNCHRNFHRKEIEGETNNSSSSCECHPHFRRKLFLGHHKTILGPESLGYPTSGGTTVIPSRATPQSMIMSYQQPSDQSDEQDGGGGVMMMGRAHHHHHHHPPLMMKKRFRTKFTQEQKEKMFNFAEKVGWKIQKQEEAVVQQFCQEIGVKRRVLKVWMHNNKHNLAKKNPSPTTTS